MISHAKLRILTLGLWGLIVWGGPEVLGNELPSGQDVKNITKATSKGGDSTKDILRPIRSSSLDLINLSEALDGKDVVFTGEVIGDIMPRGQFAWIHVQDSQGVISVWIPLVKAKTITHVGDYNSQGDVVEIVGTFVKQDAQLQGAFCIRANEIRILQQGYIKTHHFDPLKMKTLQVLLASSVCMIGLTLILRKRRKANIKITTST